MRRKYVYLCGERGRGRECERERDREVVVFEDEILFFFCLYMIHKHWVPLPPRPFFFFVLFCFVSLALVYGVSVVGKRGSMIGVRWFEKKENRKYIMLCMIDTLSLKRDKHNNGGSYWYIHVVIYGGINLCN